MLKWTIKATALTLLAALVALSLWPDLKGPSIAQGDKLAHCAFYAATSCCAILGWPSRVVTIAPGLLALGMAIEIAQRSIPGRGFEWADMAANAAGMAIGAATAFIALAALSRIQRSAH